MAAMLRSDAVISEALWPSVGDKAANWLRAAALMALGVAAMAIAAKIKVPFWPVPVTMQTFVVLTVGAAYGARLGVATMLAYLVVGALGFDVFTSSSASANGLGYMLGATGGYLVGFVVAAGVLGHLARAGWDRSFGGMALAMLIGNAIIYVPGILWLGEVVGWDKPVLQWGFTSFLLGDLAKLALAAMLFPAVWSRLRR